MVELVTVEEVYNQLRLDHDADDEWIALIIPAVSAAIISWLGDESRVYEYYLDSHGDYSVVVDSQGDRLISPQVKIAALVEIAAQFRNREGTAEQLLPEHWGHGYTLGIGATALLTGLRKPRIA